MSNEIEIITNTVVAEDRKDMFHRDFPDVAVNKEGDILVFVRECGEWAHSATYDFPAPLTFFETNPTFAIYSSSDKGVSYTRTSSMFDTFGFDPTIKCLKDGRLLAGIVTGTTCKSKDRAQLKGVFHRHLPEMNTVIGVSGVQFAFSYDNGKTWEERENVCIPGWQNHYNVRKAFEAPDGTLLVPITSGYPWQSRHVGVIRSFDGVHWGDPSVIAENINSEFCYSADIGYWEPTIAVLNDGTMVCVVVEDKRSSAPQRFKEVKYRTGVFTDYLPKLFISFSTDYGFTWSVPQDTGLWGDFPSFCKLDNGKLCLTYSARHPDHSEIVCNTTADGVTWSENKCIYKEDKVNFYYPNSINLGDGTNITVFMHAGIDKLRTTRAIRWKEV